MTLNCQLPYFREQFPGKLFFFDFDLMYWDLWSHYIKVRKLFKGGNYSRKYGMYTIEKITILPTVIRDYPLIKFEKKKSSLIFLQPPLVLEIFKMQVHNMDDSGFEQIKDFSPLCSSYLLHFHKNRQWLNDTMRDYLSGYMFCIQNRPRF